MWRLHREVLAAMEEATYKNIAIPGGWDTYAEFRRWADWVHRAQRQDGSAHGFVVMR